MLLLIVVSCGLSYAQVTLEPVDAVPSIIPPIGDSQPELARLTVGVPPPPPVNEPLLHPHPDPHPDVALVHPGDAPLHPHPLPGDAPLHPHPVPGDAPLHPHPVPAGPGPAIGAPLPQPAPLTFHDSPPHPPHPPHPVPHPEAPVPVAHVEEPVYTDQKCRIEQVDLVAEVCVPTIEKDCAPVALKTRPVTSQEKCVDVARTVCTESEEAVENNLCYYVYEESEIDGETTSVEVDYNTECEEGPQHYGSYGKEQSKVCYNKPKLSPAKSSISLEYPKAEKKCENKPVMLPKVDCKEVVESRCFSLPTSSLESTTLEKCSTRLGPPKCRQVDLSLPRQVCSRVLPPPPPPPSTPHVAHVGAHGGYHPTHGVHQGISTGHGFINLSG